VRHNVVLVVVVVVFVMVVVVAVIVVLVLVTVDVVVRVVVVTVVVVKVAVVVVPVRVDVGKKGRCTFVRPRLSWPQRLPTPPVSPLPALASLRSSFKPFAKRLESSLGTRKALLPAGCVQSQAPTTTTTNTLTRPVNHHNRREPAKIRSGTEMSV
jgi:hypothetical protein